MDFRDSLVVCSTSVTAAASSFGDKGEFGSGFLKQQGEVLINERSISEGHHQMLTFSSPNLHTTPSFPYYHNASARITGMNQTLAGLKVPFTPSQWMELEHQALIYKYITSNVPIPSYLLNPIRKAFESAGFSTQRSNPLGWGGFHLGFSSSDPEPGRCRRTDGKKWRCSREAVLDQKYCERHINRGRHRSRKPVEAQSGRAASRAPIASTAAANGVAPGGAASTLSLSRRHQLKNLQEEQQQPGSVANFNRSIPNKENNSYPLQELGLVCSDSLISSLDRSSSLLHCRRFGDSDNPNDQDNNKWENHSLRQFMNYSDRTQLSISIPMSAASDFMPFALSPKLQRSPQELEMVLQVGTTPAEHNQRQVFPISWEPSSIAGPLGEALRSTSNIHCDSLNMKHNWDNSPHLAASPTGVLQKGAFVSLSNSSAGSSPRGESIKIPDGDSRSDGIITGL